MARTGERREASSHGPGGGGGGGGGGASIANVPMLCDEVGSFPISSVVVATCNQNGDIVCSSAAVCAYHYRDPDNCWGAGCSSNDFVVGETWSATLNYPASWPTWQRLAACVGRWEQSDPHTT